jgi:hypothetical protein
MVLQPISVELEVLLDRRCNCLVLFVCARLAPWFICIKLRFDVEIANTSHFFALM